MKNRKLYQILKKVKKSLINIKTKNVWGFYNKYTLNYFFIFNVNANKYSLIVLNYIKCVWRC